MSGVSLPALEAIARAYDLCIHDCHPVRRAWRLGTNRGTFALKQAPPPPQTALIHRAGEYLTGRGFGRFPGLVLTRCGRTECSLSAGERFFLQRWVPGTPPLLDPEHPRDVRRLTRATAEMHRASMGWEAGFPRPPGQYSPETLADRLTELRGTMVSQAKGGFARLYRSLVPAALQEGEVARSLIEEAGQAHLHAEAVAIGGLCHRDLAANNALIHGAEAYLLDWDRAGAEVFPSDLAMLVRRIVGAQEWPPALAEAVLKSYEEVRHLTTTERRVTIACLHWPQAFWRLGHQYFAEWLDRPESFFLERLRHWTSQSNARRRFLGYCRAHLW